MPTLILSPRYTPDSIALAGFAIESGWKVERLLSWRPSPDLRDAKPVVYGEPLFCAAVAESLGLMLLQADFQWLPRLPDQYKKREVLFSILGNVRGLRGDWFIKPADDKCFPARVYSSGAELPGASVLPDSTPVLIAEPVAWEAEFRCFVLEGEVITISPYARNGELAQNESGEWLASQSELENAFEFGSSVVQDSGVSLPPAAVLDIGIIEGRGWAVVETNAAWASGIYGGAPDQVLKVLARACRKIEDLSPDDARWIIAPS